MKPSFNFVGLSGSLREKSYSSSVLATFEQLLSARGHGLGRVDIGEMPHYNQDIEDTVVPEPGADARERVKHCDGIVIVTPEFNHGIPGVLKNALDWLSRPAFASCFADKAVLFCTLSPGALGGVRAQHQLRETLSSMLCDLVPMPEIVIGNVAQKCANGMLSDQSTIDFIATSIDQLTRGIAIRSGAELAFSGPA
jgi:chromate reductase, NAD(P)H dehydrogenase (quinone)